MYAFRFFISIIFTIAISASFCSAFQQNKSRTVQDTTKFDRDYALEATMLGFFAPDGARNPTLKANKGDRVRIKITNGELMTHDISLEKLGLKSKVIIEKGATTSIVFKASQSDVYYCSVPGHRAAGMVGNFEVVEGIISDKTVAGQMPMKDGKPLNLNFETGTLQDWIATGDAFTNALVNEDPSPIHEKDMKIGFEGEYFLSSGGTLNYRQTGTLTSVPFKVTQPFAAFRVSGGALQDTRVELLLAGTDSVIYHITGQGRATLQPAVVDLKAYLSKEIFIRIIDNETGISQIPYIPNDKWAHINFDEFLFYPTRPDFPNELKQKDIIILPPLDPVLNAGLSGLEAAKAMSLPKGFNITLAASEPDIICPISFTIDPKGRLWVVEGHTYPVPAPEGQGKDRILIFEDTDGDGTLDKRKVFMEGLNLVSGIEVGMGGVWLGAAPYLLFIPIDVKNDKPAGPPQKLLDGWGTDDTHEVLNNLRWGPDGWLYGTHGVFTHSNVGKPGATDAERTKINAGVWRYHPTSRQFEVFAEGSSNPWGIDFNDYGHPFITVCVIPHMYHVIQGARYQRQAGNHFNPYTYDDIKTIADHVHWVGERGPHAGNFRSASAGGGHAHAGAMIYLGGDTWPKEYRNDIFMNNINGAKMNIDHLTRSGSGYEATHKNDFLSMNDSWSQWLNFKYDPSGSVYAIDWYDKNQCHSPNPDVHNKTMGRIFKITHDNDKFVKVDLTKASDKELVNYQLNTNEWYVRQARTILQERGANKKVHKALKEILSKNQDPTRKLRALWALHVTQGLTEKYLTELLASENEYVRSWAIQLLVENKKASPETLRQLATLAQKDNSALVRLYLASAMQRLDPSQRWEVVDALAQKSEDKDDHNLPLMVWFAAEPLAALDMKRALQMAEKAKLPKILHYTIQRVGAIGTEESKKLLKEFNDRLGKTHSHEHHETQMLIGKVLEK
ncbi:putative membrane-bound dehydrogenase domain-containing protein [Dyadobacter koreensis]|uniref:Putative membrane-bound dehydrogenase domain-containing protein n=1 Tax=Dyadobacter koreensis TaxID=408657 RepID=A0A1H6QL51_9BACT|nr:PVC-type heme-binding CxxCH protein [Dyadobacter koreensis]SEI44409.1 putative membrane-bound dehydrogenase domain-containing protein [Dyadobacter koreensis]